MNVPSAGQLPVANQLPVVNQVQDVNISALQEMVSKAVKRITMAMLSALMSCKEENLDFKGLAQKFINPSHAEEISNCDSNIQMIYTKLFKATHEFIQNQSPPLVYTLALISEQTGNPESAGMFIGTFIFPEAKAINEQLKEYPAALNKVIWA